MESTYFEAAFNGKFDELPFTDIERGDVSEIFNIVDPSGNSLLHVMSGNSLLHVPSISDYEEMTQHIARKFPFLITKQNNEGNTALHLAVGAQKLNTVTALVDIFNQFLNTSTSADTLLTMKNAEGNTALHEALFAILDASKKNLHALVEMACFLVRKDPDVTCHLNKAGKSPLCMAVESGDKEIVEEILNALPDQSGGLLQRLEGKSPVHVAIEHKNLDMLRTIKEKKEDLLLLRDEEGNSPLHFAALKGYKEGVHYLLESKSNWAFERNTLGCYPIHLACENGHVKVMKELFRKWSDAAKWLDPAALLCGKGQSILHVAAKSGNDIVVRCILSEKGTDRLVNKMDKNGNTPYHLAALYGHSMVMVTLIRDKRSKTNLVNYQGLTTYDILKSNVLKVQGQQIDVNGRNLEVAGIVEENSAEVDSKSFDKQKQFQMIMLYRILMIFPIFSQRHGPFQRLRHHQSSTKMSHDKIKPLAPKQDLNNTINYLFVVTALIVGVAFAGALQIPYESGNGSGSGSSEKENKRILSVYLFANITTMNLSLIAGFSLFLALVIDTNLASMLVSVSFLLLELALINLGTAFFAAIQLRLLILGDQYQEDPPIVRFQTAIYIFQYIESSIFVISVFLFSLGREGSAIIIYLILFCFYFPLYRLWSIISFIPRKNVIKFVICVPFLLFVLNFFTYY